MAMPEEASTVRPFPKVVDRARQPEPQTEPATVPAELPEAAPQPETPAAAPPQPVQAAVEPPKKKGGARKVVFGLVAVAALAGGAWYGHDYWTVGRFTVSTDDAYVGADLTILSPKVGGYVANVDVVANSHVKAGDPLVELENGDYVIARDQAKAKIASQELTLKRIDAQRQGALASVAQAQAQRESAEAVQRNAATAQKRAVDLVKSRVGSQATLDQANASLDQANAALAAAAAQIQAAQANADVFAAQRDEAASTIASLQLDLQKAERDLGFTVLRAPYDGIVGNLSVQKGNLVSAGNRLLALVPSDALYVDANFKETQLASIAPGETAKVSVDALDGEPITGTVESIAPASGSVFSLLPAENATGNFTKVVQRVPVRVKLPAEALTSGKLRAGLSVVVDIDSRTMPGYVKPPQTGISKMFSSLTGRSFGGQEAKAKP